MRTIRVSTLVAVCVSLLVLSCTDGPSPSDLQTGPTATLALALALAPSPSNFGQNVPLPINRIRITVLRVPDNSVVTVHEENVDPNAEFWDLAVEIPLPVAGILRVRLRIELINVTIVGGEEVETVEYSALTDGIDLIAGETPELTTVTVERGPVDNLAVTALTILPAGPVVEGDVLQLEASVTTNDPNANPSLFWTSLDEALATVDDDGLVQALLPGEVEIVVTAGAQSASLLLGILQRVAGISLSPSNLVLEHVGEEGSFTATVVDPRGDPIETPVEWSVGNATVVENLGEGSVRALAPGSTDVTATVIADPTFTGSAMVLVELIPTAVSVTPEEAALTFLGEQVQFIALVTDLEGSVLSGVSVGWRSSDQTVALVSASGLTTAVGPGAATIFADVETGRSASAGAGAAEWVIISGSASVVVTQTVTTVEVTPAELTLDGVGASSILFATAFDAGGTSVSGATFEWASSNSGVAVVNATGTVTATGVGTATVTATFEGVSGSAAVEVIVSGPENHSFTTAGNTQLRGGTFPLPLTPTVKVPGLLANTPGLTVTTLGPFATSGGGSVTIEPDGDFLYTPPINDNITDLFQYTVASGATATVTISVVDMVWYLNNLAGLGNGTGASEDPFGSVIDFAIASDPAAGHTIFLHTGDGTTLNYDRGITLLDNQKLIGEGVGLTVAGVGAIVPAGVAPKITNDEVKSSENAVTLANGNTVSGLTIEAPLGAGISATGSIGGTVTQVSVIGPLGVGVHLSSTSGTFTFTTVDIQNSGAQGVNLVTAGGSITFNDLSISGALGTTFRVSGGAPTVVANVGAAGIVNTTAFREVLSIVSMTGGSVTFNGGSMTDTGGSGIGIFSTGGAVTVNTPVTITNPSGSGVDILGATAPVTFADLDVTIPPPELPLAASRVAAFEPVQDGALARLGGTTAGVNIESTSGTVTFGTLHSSTGNVRALNISTSETVRVTDPSSTLAASLHMGIDVSSADLDMTFASVSSSNSPAQGIRLNSATGTLTMNGGSIGTPGGAGIRIASGSADVTYNGTVTGSAFSGSLDIQSNTGGTLTFGGQITDSGTGINLLNNTGTTINFNGGLDLDTGANTAFNATGGGTVNVTGTGNTVNTTTGTGVNIDNTTIGASGVTFESVSVNGAPNGIVLTNTGSGAFAVTGTGGANSGGSILNTTGAGIDISGSTAGSTFTFTSLDIDNSATAGVSLSGTNGTFALQSSTVINSGNFAFAGVDLLDHVGSATISNSTVSSSQQDNVKVQNDVGPLALTVSGSTFNNSSGKGGIGLAIQTGTNASVTATVTGSTFTVNAIGLGGFSSGTSTLDLTVQSSNSFSNNGDGIVLDNSGGGTLTFDVMGNGFTGNSFNAVDLRSTSTGLMSGSITGNTISGGPLLSRGIDMFFDGDTDAIVRTSGNNISGGSHGVMVELGFITDDLSTLDLTIETEIMVLDLASTTPGIDVTAFEETTLCTNIRSNTITVGGANFIELRQNDLSTVSVERLLDGSESTSDEATVESFLETENPLSPDAAFVTIATFIQGVPTGTCRTP